MDSILDQASIWFFEYKINFILSIFIVGLYELLLMSDEIRHLITSGADANVIRKQGVKEGMKTLREDALEKLRSGMTTPEEVVRVTRAI